MDENEKRLLQSVGSAESAATWDEVKNDCGLTANEYKKVVRAAVRHGYILLNGSQAKPSLELTEEGRRRLARYSTVEQAGVAGVRSLLVFVALEFELDVLRRRWGLTQEYPQRTWTGLCEGVPVHVLPAHNAGRVEAAVETLDYLNEPGTEIPDLVVVLGICGGFEEGGVSRGDVINAQVIADLGSRKMRNGPDGDHPEFRIKAHNTDDRLTRIFQSGSFDKNAWMSQAVSDFDFPEGRHPTLRNGAGATLVSVDEVVSTDDWRTALRTAWPKALGVEMEAGGVFAACTRKKVPVAVLRGVSDLANPLKADDEWRQRAMRTAVLAFESALKVLKKAEPD
ncbi:5'-methylthioadenosine/S-adenosylhomocysteine nucleosidase family protein [Streptomyces sp. NPDC003832]